MIVAQHHPNVAGLLQDGPIVVSASVKARPAEAGRHMAFLGTAWGTCAVVWKIMEDTHGNFGEKPGSALLCRILTPGLSHQELRKQIMKQHGACDEVMGDREGNFHPEVVPTWFPELARYLRAYYTDGVCGGVGSDLTNTWNMWRLRLDWSSLTPFQRTVLEATAMIPRGHRLTYGQIAKKVGKPQASRAVGAALGANPWPVLIPCHRVVGSNGKLTGFSAPGGVETKKRMLEMEQGMGTLFR